jgi:hypothetical protein
MYGRTGVLDGESIRLKVVFTDGEGNLVDPASLPVVYIYDPTLDTDSIQLEIDAATFTSAYAGPFTSVKLDVGFYLYEYAVPLGAEAGLWRDVWTATIGTTDVDSILTFTVLNGADLSEQKLANNQLVIVELDATIASYVGDVLGSDTQITFATTMSPYYASVDLVRMEGGPWLDFIPDITLAMMIQWSSREVDFITPAGRKSGDRIKFARAKFVTFDAILRAFSLPGSYANQPGGILGGSKRLGDLAIGNGTGSVVARTASGIDTYTLNDLKAKRAEWWRVVNANSEINPGQSLGFETAQKGRYDPDRRIDGRQWADPSIFSYGQPGVNAKGRFYGYNRGKNYWSNSVSSSGLQ